MNKKLLFFLSAFCLLATLASAAQYDDEILALFTETQQGDGTYYGYTSGGSCTLDPTPKSGQVDKNAAMNAPQYYGSAVCGMCLQMVGDGTGSGLDPINGTFVVYINNLCPECHTGDLDLGDVPPGSGRWNIQWKAIPCPGNIGNLQYMAQGSHEYYIKLQVRNHRIPVSEVHLKQGNSYKTLSRTEDNFFISAGDVDFPLPDTIDIRVVAIDGQTVDDQVTLDDIKSGNPFNSATGVQFAALDGFSSGSSVSSASPTSISTFTTLDSSGSPLSTRSSGLDSPLSSFFSSGSGSSSSASVLAINVGFISLCSGLISFLFFF